MSELSHFDQKGQAHMVDIQDKAVTHRIAVAEGYVRMDAATLARVEQGSHKKGDVLGVARLAAIMGAKRTSDLIPLCHPLPLTHVSVEFTIEHIPAPRVRCVVRAETDGKTGVEMEALTAVQIATLTIYDMCKAIDKGMIIDGVRLLEKHGGKSGTYLA